MDLENMLYLTTMSNGDVWAVPVIVIATHRAAYYAEEFGGDIQRSLDEDTIPLFFDDYEIHDWAANNMDWSDVRDLAFKYKVSEEPDFQEGWCNGEHKVISK